MPPKARRPAPPAPRAHMSFLLPEQPVPSHANGFVPQGLGPRKKGGRRCSKGPQPPYCW